MNGRYRGYSSERRYRKNHPSPSQWLLLRSRQGARPRLLISTRRPQQVTGAIAAKVICLPLFQRSRGVCPKSLRQPKRAAQIWSSSILHHEQNGRPWPPPARLIWYLFPAAPQSSILRLSQQHLTLSPPLAQSHSPPYSMRCPPRGKKRQQAEQVLKELNIVVCPEVFGDRVAFDHANTAGLSAQEYKPAGKAAAEIQNVYMSACRLVDMSKRGGAHGKNRLAASNA